MDQTSKKSSAPTPDQVGKLIGGLLGRNVAVRRASPVTRGPEALTALAVYLGDTDSLRGAMICDLALVCNAGAALTLYPAPDAAACVRKGRWDDTLTENFHEVVNVSAALFNMPGAPHARLQRVYLAPDAPPAEVERALREAKGRLDLEVTIPGYGPGKLSVLAL